MSTRISLNDCLLSLFSVSPLKYLRSVFTVCSLWQELDIRQAGMTQSSKLRGFRQNRKIRKRIGKEKCCQTNRTWATQPFLHHEEIKNTHMHAHTHTSQTQNSHIREKENRRAERARDEDFHAQLSMFSFGSIFISFSVCLLLKVILGLVVRGRI